MQPCRCVTYFLNTPNTKNASYLLKYFYCQLQHILQLERQRFGSLHLKMTGIEFIRIYQTDKKISCLTGPSVETKYRPISSRVRSTR